MKYMQVMFCFNCGHALNKNIHQLSLILFFSFEGQKISFTTPLKSSQQWLFYLCFTVYKIRYNGK